MEFQSDNLQRWWLILIKLHHIIIQRSEYISVSSTRYYYVVAIIKDVFFCFFFLTDSSEGCLFSKKTYLQLQNGEFLYVHLWPNLERFEVKQLEVFVFTSPGCSCYKKRSTKRNHAFFVGQKRMPTKEKNAKKNPGRLFRSSSPQKRCGENGKHMETPSIICVTLGGWRFVEPLGVCFVSDCSIAWDHGWW